MNTKQEQDKMTYTQADKDRLIEKLTEYLGIVTISCREAGISRTTHYMWLDNDPIYKKAVADIQEVQLDTVENRFFQNINSGDVQSILFYLRTKAKKRGYVEKQEIDMTVNDLTIKFDFGNNLPSHNQDSLPEETKQIDNE